MLMAVDTPAVLAPATSGLFVTPEGCDDAYLKFPQRALIYQCDLSCIFGFPENP
jgi:hypothetical protein